MNNKLSVLGYYGVCPNVDIHVQHVDQPIVLTFVLSGSAGEGTFETSFDVVDESGVRVVAATSTQPYQANLDSPSTFAPTLIMTFGSAGTYILRCFMSGEECFRAPFTISHMRRRSEPQ